MFFGKVYEAAAAELAVDAIVQIRGQVELRDETVSLRATEMQIPTLEAEDERPLVITLPSVALERQRMMQLGQVLANHRIVTAKYILRCWMRRVTLRCSRLAIVSASSEILRCLLRSRFCLAPAACLPPDWRVSPWPLPQELALLGLLHQRS